jgi:predicted dienelactone hydrolase
MNRKKASGLIFFIVVILISCNSSRVYPQIPITIPIEATDSTPELTPTTLSTPSSNAHQEPEDSETFILAERGPYWTGNKSYTLVDPSRTSREIRITIHYPALKEFSSDNNPITRDAVPDLSGAPYPIILTGPNTGDLLFESHLASHGFVMVIVRPPYFHYEDSWDMNVIDGPLDFLFALDQLTSSPPDGLSSMLDTDHVGVAGYSWDGFFSLTLSGAQVDPDHYSSICKQIAFPDSSFSPGKFDLYCGLGDKWDQFQEYAKEVGISNPDGLWGSLTDERILAAIPMAPDGAWLYGERGVSVIQIPTLIITGTDDDICSYDSETVYIFKNIGSSEKFLISFIDKNHMMVFNTEVGTRIRHFATAFFGYHLQGIEDYQVYYSEDFVNQFNDLYWGVYTK